MRCKVEGRAEWGTRWSKLSLYLCLRGGPLSFSFFSLIIECETIEIA